MYTNVMREERKQTAASRDSRVFVCYENPAVNYTSAEAWGEVQFITRTDFANSENSLHNVRLIKDIKRRLADFDVAKDYIVCSTAPVVVAAVFLVLGRIGYDAVKCLRWSNRDQRYYEVVLSLYGDE